MRPIDTIHMVYMIAYVIHNVKIRENTCSSIVTPVIDFTKISMVYNCCVFYRTFYKILQKYYKNYFISLQIV